MPIFLDSVKLSDWLTILALIVGPVSAVQVQKFIERKNDTKNRRLWIFKTLMATRGAVLSFNHVEALNRIDLEFPDKRKYLKLLESWKIYFDNLSEQKKTDEEIKLWAERNTDMGLSLGYNFDLELIKKHIYSPQGHEKAETENRQIREETLKILRGESSIPVILNSIAKDEESENKIRQLQELLIQYYTVELNKNK